MRSTTLTASRTYAGTNYVTARREFAQLQKNLMDQADRMKVQIVWETLMINSEKFHVDTSTMFNVEFEEYTSWTATVTAVYGGVE